MIIMESDRGKNWKNAMLRSMSSQGHQRSDTICPHV
uniref:Uncharacterized protein n=1 Tax=Anguilla anguilla TaxID=7936 RepID=A0A0E9Q9A1_ANGAN